MTNDRASSICRTSLIVATLLVARTASAEVTRCASADAGVRYHDALFSQLSGDTGWFPSSSPAQLRLTARIAGETTVAMGLRPTACWNGPMMISVSGQPQAGQLDFAYGAELHLFAQIHTSILGNAIDWQGEIPLPTDFLLGNTATFDPAMLPGSVVDHVAASDTTSPLKLLSTDLIGTYIGIPGISGGLHLDAVGQLTTTYRTTAVAVGASPITTVDGAVANPSPSTTFGPALDLPIAATGTVGYAPALIFNVAFDVKILGIRVVNFTLYSLTVPLPQLDDPITLAGAGAHIPLPLAPPLDGARVDFADATSQTLAIHNAGEGPLMIEATTLPAGVTAAPITIAPGADGSLALTITAAALADGQATVTLATNDPNQPRATITVGRDIGGTSLPGKDGEPGGCNTTGGTHGLAVLLVAAALLARRRTRRRRRDDD